MNTKQHTELSTQAARMLIQLATHQHGEMELRPAVATELAEHKLCRIVEPAEDQRAYARCKVTAKGRAEAPQQDKQLREAAARTPVQMTARSARAFVAAARKTSGGSCVSGAYLAEQLERLGLVHAVRMDDQRLRASWLLTDKGHEQVELQAAKLAEAEALGKEFAWITRGIRPHRLCFAMCRLTSGIDWRGCTKKHLTEEWSEAGFDHCHISGDRLDTFLGYVAEDLEADRRKDIMGHIEPTARRRDLHRLVDTGWYGRNDPDYEKAERRRDAVEQLHTTGKAADGRVVAGLRRQGLVDSDGTLTATGVLAAAFILNRKAGWARSKAANAERSVNGTFAFAYPKRAAKAKRELAEHTREADRLQRMAMRAWAEFKQLDKREREQREVANA